MVVEKAEILFVRKDVNEVLAQASEITVKQKAEYEAAQALAKENLEKAGITKK